MNVVKIAAPAVLAALLAGPDFALACHELVVTTGRGLATQAYIAPNPTNVLVLHTDTSHDREYAGLRLAGHRLTLVADIEALADEIARNDYDIVITPFDVADVVMQRIAADDSVRVLPIVSRAMRRDPEVRDRFARYLVDGAGVARFLAVINRVMAG